MFANDYCPSFTDEALTCIYGEIKVCLENITPSVGTAGDSYYTVGNANLYIL